MTAPPLADLASSLWRLSPDLLAEHLTREKPGEPLPPYTYTRPPHLRLIARKVRECAAKPGGRLIINVPPQHAKSSTVSHFGTAWYLALNPRHHVGVVSYGAEFAGGWGRKVRNTFATNGEELGVQLAADSKAAGAFELAAGGGMWTAGSSGSITGRPAMLIIIDDPHKDYDEAHSKVVREAVWNSYLTSVRTRLGPGASIIIICTRWHVDDLCGRLIKQDADGIGEGWEVVRLPAIAEEHEEWDLGGDEAWVREPGDPLWPGRYDAAYLNATRLTLGPYRWSGLYQQHPSPPGGTVINRDWFERRWSELPSHMDEWLGSVDCAFKDAEDSDYVVIQVWGRHGADRFLIHETRDQMSFTATCTAVENVVSMFPKCRRMLVEDKANGPAVINAMKKKVSGLVPRNPQGSKMSRLIGCQGEIESGNVVLPEQSKVTWSVAEFIEEICTFTGKDGETDDRVDAMTQALLEWGALAPKSHKVTSSTVAGRKLPPPKKRVMPPNRPRR